MATGHPSLLPVAQLRANINMMFRSAKWVLMFLFLCHCLFSRSPGGGGSFYGDLHAYGKQAVRFYTETKTVTSRWFDDDIPTGPNLTIHLR